MQLEPCPFCKRKHALRIDPVRKMFRCFHCGTIGDTEDFEAMVAERKKGRGWRERIHEMNHKKRQDAVREEIRRRENWDGQSRENGPGEKSCGTTEGN
jgi:hypothetical protein